MIAPKITYRDHKSIYINIFGIFNFRHLKSSSGFTLIEALIAVALLALVAAGIAVPYASGLQALDVQAESMALDSRLRSRMEVLASTRFESLAGGSETLTVSGQNFTIAWTVVPADLNADGVADPTAVQIAVSVTERPNHTLTVIRVNDKGKVGKIP